MSATSKVPTDTYGVDPVHSTFGFTVVHNGISKFRGSFEQVDGKLENGVLTGVAKVDSVKTAIPQLHGHLQTPDFFDAESNPEITFTSTDIRVADDGTAEVDGDLTIRGVTKPVTASGTFATGVNMQGAEVAGFDLSTTVDRREFGINWQAPLPNGGEAVAYPVTIETHIELAKA
jgi:polyisoprenoid-binding protein YceI